MTLSSLSNFIPTRLGCMKAWAACNSLDWVTCYPLHFTLVYIVYRESRTRQVVYIHVQYGRPQWNVHWNRQSLDWLVTLLHYFFLENRPNEQTIKLRMAVCPHKKLRGRRADETNGIERTFTHDLIVYLYV